MKVSLLLTALSCLPTLQAFGELQKPLGGVPFVLRDANVDDADDIATVIIDAFSAAPDWNYVHQFEDEYPGLAWMCARNAYKSIFEEDAAFHYVIRVIAVPDQTAPTSSRVVSFSLWDFNRTGQHHSTFFPVDIAGTGNCSYRPDLNTTRNEQYLGSILENEEKYLDAVYEHQVYLGGLATHPQWDGHGFAKTHLDWGMAIADSMELPTTLTATKAGHPLYKSVGFEDLHNGTIVRLDGKGIIWHEVMKYSAEN
ncbi:hypothetical protein BJ166DRAFT_514701 [Pestalotiopsis sp. NC0098]|nr:hypothetical protein BJ166DRAFT_514701 [Pestalotiopsis sp. NC0098]